MNAPAAKLPLLKLALQKSIPAIFSILFLMAGSLLLVSGALPAIPEHVHWLQRLIPLTFVEFWHLAGSIAGVTLLFLARGVWLRLDAAYYGCIGVLLIGIFASIFKGFDWREACTLSFMLFMFIPTRRYFYRRASVFTMPFTAGWVYLIILIMAVSALMGFEAYKHVPYVQDIWWRFSYHEDAPRFLRALFVTTLIVLAYGLNNALRVSRVIQISKPDDAEIEKAREVAGLSHDTIGFLSLLGDKALLWSEDRRSFIMYTTTPHAWIAMGDPVGEAQHYADLVWRFREQADLHGARAVFYEISDKFLPLYLDRGFTLLKMGEEARIFLPEFSMEGGRRENQRKIRNKFSKSGFIFRVLEQEEIAAHLPELRRISDAWLGHKNAHEKGFSLGFFDERYIGHTRIAVAEKDGVIQAFANLWELENRNAISVDLMRYDPASPPSMMEYVFIECLLWAQRGGYHWFGLGMAPLSGMEKHELAPLWHKIGSIIYAHGSDFYNFEGLHAYKSKFDPVWIPRYLASPPGLRIPLVMLSVAGIISGGITKVFRK